MANTTNKVFDAALGLVSQANETWKKGLNELVEKGKLTRLEGDKMLNNLEAKISEGRKDYEQFAKDMYNNVTNALTDNDAPVVTDAEEVQNQRIEALELKVNLLLREIMELKKNAATPAVKAKAPATRSRKKTVTKAK